MHFKLILILVLSALAVVFILQNVTDVEVQFLFWSTQLPRSLLIFLLLTTGFLLGWFLHGYLRFRRRRVR